MYSSFRIHILPAVSAVALLLLITGCVSKDKQAGSNQLFFDYTITGEEENDSVTVMLQYREEEAGEVVSIEGLGKVTLDSIPLLAESTKVTGAYYEVQLPLAEFTGSHTIIYTSIDNKQYKEQFNFQPLILLTEIPETVPRGDLELELGGLEEGDLVRVLLTDTLFGSEGIDRLDTVTGNSVFISREDMEELTDGPIQLQLVKESETQAKNATRKGGRVYMSYKLKREFILAKEPE